MFLFQSAGLCIAHLQHPRTEQGLVLLGHVGMVTGPVDGVYTMSQADMVAVLE